MSFISKLRGGNKGADQSRRPDTPQNTVDSNTTVQSNADAETRTTNARRSWTADDMRQVNRIAQPRLYRTRSDQSVRSVRSHYSRTSSSGLSSELNLPQPFKVGRRHRSPIGASNFQCLEKVDEGNGDGHAVLPTAGRVTSFRHSHSYSNSMASSSSSTRLRTAKWQMSTAERSPLSSAETSPTNSEGSSSASSHSSHSSTSSEVLELRSHPYSHAEQFVFDKSNKGKARAIMVLPEIDLLNTEDDFTVDLPQSPVSGKVERKYFAHEASSAPQSPELPSTPDIAASPQSAPSSPQSKRRSIFGRFRRASSDKAVTA